MYKAVFYDDPKTGELPVQNYLNSLDDNTAGYIWEVIKQFEETGKLNYPLASHVDKSIWELRFSKKGKRQRILYAIVVAQRILLLEAFDKTTPKTPKRYINTAKERLAEYRARPEVKRLEEVKKLKGHAQTKKKKR